MLLLMSTYPFIRQIGQSIGLFPEVSLNIVPGSHTREQFSENNKSHKSTKLYDPGNYVLLLYLNPEVALKIHVYISISHTVS